MRYIQPLIVALMLGGCGAEQGTPYEGSDFFAEICEGLPRAANTALPLSGASDDWFQVYESAEGVYSIVEPNQFQETISHLILGDERAILFDTGLGLFPIRPVVERITDLPVTVLNSHTHFDHVGGNAEFASILAVDTEYTRANMAGFGNARIGEDFVAEAFCNGPPAGVDLTKMHTRAWQASEFVADGDILDLGGRRLEVLHVPGHTPDATALLDAENGLLFTGDSFYDAEIWLFAPETNLEEYDRAISRLAGIEEDVKYLFGAHVAARVDAGPLANVRDAFHKLRSGEFDVAPDSGGRLAFLIDDIEFVTSQPVLDGRQGNVANGGSGLDTWFGGTAITNVTVIDPINKVRQQQTVVFDGDNIVSVGPNDASIEAVQTIDGTGKFLIPGLWDFHVHLSYDDRLTADMPRLFLSYGVTSVRDTGGLMHRMLPIVEEMRAAGAVAPRVWFSGPLLDGNFVVYDGESREEIGVRNATPEEARDTVRGLKEQGVDFIKIYEMVSPEVFEAMVETARELDLPIDSHVPLSMRAIDAGPPVDAIQHLRNIEFDCAANAEELHATRLEILENPDGISGYALRSTLHDLQRLPAIAAYDEARCNEVIDSLVTTTQVPTLRMSALNLAPPSAKPDWEDALSRVGEDVREEWAEAAVQAAANPLEEYTAFGVWARFLTGRMHERGVPIAAGTDTPIFISVPGYGLHSELEQLVASGLTPLEALHAATVQPAIFFGIEDEMGTIQPGMRADLVLLDANPLDDISNTRRISGVVSKGVFFDPGDFLSQ